MEDGKKRARVPAPHNQLGTEYQVLGTKSPTLRAGATINNLSMTGPEAQFCATNLSVYSTLRRSK